jgi:hypothetical protein
VQLEPRDENVEDTADRVVDHRRLAPLSVSGRPRDAIVKRAARVAQEDVPSVAHHYLSVHERLEYGERARIRGRCNSLRGARHAFGGRLPEPFESLLERHRVGASRSAEQQEPEDDDRGG